MKVREEGNIARVGYAMGGVGWGVERDGLRRLLLSPPLCFLFEEMEERGEAADITCVGIRDTPAGYDAEGRGQRAGWMGRGARRAPANAVPMPLGILEGFGPGLS